MENLEKKAKNLRLKTLDLALKTGEGHLGGSFSEIELLISLYDKILTKQDKFILSKGHACYPFYLLLQEKGYDPKITMHPDIDIDNGVCCTTGSLGHGLPIGVGMAFARKKQEKPGRIYVLIGDGECQEGTTWESSDIAVYHNLDNLTAIVDFNKVQALDKTKDVSTMNLADKFKTFGWYVSEINGHDFSEIIPVLEQKPEGKPYMIIAHTIKGKGVSYMENNPEWHGRKVTLERVKKAYEELNRS
ncbi:MAG: transketolase [Nanoarchaeota archaeon]|mgnify:CR=1 FL=1